MKREAVIMAAIMNAPVEVSDSYGGRGGFTVELGGVNITTLYWAVPEIVLEKTDEGQYCLTYVPTKLEEESEQANLDRTYAHQR